MNTFDFIYDFVTDAAAERKACPAGIGIVSGGNLVVLSAASVDPRMEPHPLFIRAGGYPTLAALLMAHSNAVDTRDNLKKPDKDKSEYLIAIVGYPPHLADFGMAYRNDIRYVNGAQPSHE